MVRRNIIGGGLITSENSQKPTVPYRRLSFIGFVSTNSAAESFRSRCGSVRGAPLFSSQGSPTAARREKCFFTSPAPYVPRNFSITDLTALAPVTGEARNAAFTPRASIRIYGFLSTFLYHCASAPCTGRT
jgi:hypothetical protein